MFIVTTTRPCPEGHTEPLLQGDGSGWNGNAYHTPPCTVCNDRCEVEIARRAVDTIDDVWRYVMEDGLPASMPLGDAVKLLDTLTDQGGTIGPFPGAITISVERVAP